MIHRIRRIIGGIALAILLAILTLAGFAVLHGRPQDLPWTPLDLSQPIGLFTGPKLTALTGEFPECRALLGAAGVRYHILPERHDGRCGYADGVRFQPGGSRSIAFAPESPGISCPVAAALSLWEWNIVQPSAQRLFGQRVEIIDHFGSYNCRRINGRETGGWSEHSTADAIDIAGFRLAAGKRITVKRDWAGDGLEATFLHEARNGACRLFSTTLSPDYNPAHADHLHLDQAERGAMGGRVCH